MLTKREYNRYRIFRNVTNNSIEIYDYNLGCFIHEIYLDWLTEWGTGSAARIAYGCSLPYMGHILEWLVNFHPN